MKRILIVIIILLVAGTAVFAQKAGGPTRENMEEYYNQANENASEYESMLDDLKSRNSTSGDIAAFNRLKAEIDRLESRINTESGNITATHDKGNRVNSEIINSLERLISQHKARVEELEKLLSKDQEKDQKKDQNKKK